MRNGARKDREAAASTWKWVPNHSHRHLQVAQPQCTFECDMSSLVIFQHMHPRTVASLDTRRGGGGFLLFLILLLSGAWIIGPSSSFSVPAPLSSEIASCCERVINNNHTFALPFDSTLGFPGEQNERVERESNARLDAPTCSRAFLFCMSKQPKMGKVGCASGLADGGGQWCAV